MALGVSAQKNAYHRKAFTKSKPINYNGQWRGSFNDDTLSFSLNQGSFVGYVLELEIHNNQITGSSYSYFNSGQNKYYTICRVTGTLDPKTKEMEVVEVEKLKSNTPAGFGTCLQIHKLKYEKQADGSEVLRGTWIPAPNQATDCGVGITVLSRRVMDINPLGIKPPSKANQKPAIVKTIPKKPTAVKPSPSHAKPVPKQQTAIAQEKAKPPVVANNERKIPEKSMTLIPDESVEKPIKIPGTITSTTIKGFEKRRKNCRIPT